MNEEYRVDIKIRNNTFLYRLEKAGYKTVGELCRVHNKMNYASTIGSIVNMTESPLQSNGNWKKPILFCAKHLSCSPEDLFTDVQLNTILKTNKKSIQVNEAEMKFMIENKFDNQKLLEDKIFENERDEELINQVSILTNREQKVINMIYGLDKYDKEYTLQEIGEELGISGNRVRQIKEKAFRKIRHPDRSKNLRQFLEESE